MTSTLDTAPAPSNRPRARLATVALFGMCVGAALTCAVPSTAAEVATQDPACHLDPAYLPHTADAIDGWYSQCRNRANTAASTEGPTTPDAIEGWLRQN